MMRFIPFMFLGWAIGCILVLLVFAVNSHATPPRYKLAPPWPCTMENRLEIFVDEDRIMYACECEALSTGHICRWQVIGGVESRSVRRFKKQHTRLVISYARPAVIA